MEDVQEYLKNRLNEFKQGYNAEYKLKLIGKKRRINGNILTV